MASPAATPPEPLTVEFRILAILDLVPLILLLVTEEVSRESELLPEEAVEVGLGSWLIVMFQIDFNILLYTSHCDIVFEEAVISEKYKIENVRRCYFLFQSFLNIGLSLCTF